MPVRTRTDISKKNTMSAPSNHYAAPLLVVGCVVFGLGSLIVKFVPVGAYAIAWWRLLISGLVFWFLARRFGQKLPRSKTALAYALLSGAALGIDLALWHESIYSVGPGIFHPCSTVCRFFSFLPSAFSCLTRG